MPRRLFVMSLSLFALAAAGFGAGFARYSTQALMVLCIDPAPIPGRVDDGSAAPLPADLYCAYLNWIRRPDPGAIDPNPLVASGPRQTHLGFALAGYEAGNPRSRALLEHLIHRGVRWDEPAIGRLPPLHLAVLSRTTTLVRRFLDAGANPRTRIDDPSKPMDGLDAFDVARLMHFHSKDPMDDDEVAQWIELEGLLCDDPNVNAHAQTAPARLRLDGSPHRLEQIDFFGDDNPYPAGNYDMLAQVVHGPFGDQASAHLGFASVWRTERVTVPCETTPGEVDAPCARDPARAVAPSRLEVLSTVPARPAGEDGPPDEIKTTPLPSLRDRPGRSARLVRLRSVAVEPLGSSYGVRAVAEFVQGCHGEPYLEEIVLTWRAGQPQRVLIKDAAPSTPAR